MKIFKLAVLAGLMIVGLASTAMAEITVGGSIATRYDMFHNMDLNDTTAVDSKNFFNSRIMLNVDAKVTEGLQGFVEIDTATDLWGQPGTAIVNPFSNAGNGVVGSNPSYFDHNGNNMAIRQAWVNFMVPGTPVGVKIGHQGFALGHGIWLDTTRYGSDGILVYAKPMDSLLVAGAYAKGAEGFTNVFPTSMAVTNASVCDADFYAVLANYSFMENNTAGVHVSYVTDGNTFGGNDLWATNVGLVADGTMGMVTYKAEFDWLHVNLKDVIAVGTDFTNDGYAGILGASVNVNPVTVGVEAGMGTGGNINENAGIGSLGYFTPYNITSYNYAFIYNDKVGQDVTGAGNGLRGGNGFGTGHGGFGLANTMYAKLSAKAAPMDRLKAGMDVLYLRAHNTVVAGQSKNLGWEIDANVSYKLYDNLTLNVNGGYFIAGKWYAYGAAALPTDNAYALETSLVMKF